MTIQVPYRGVIEIVGDHDVGKTIAALQTSNNMKEVVFVDDDVKGEGTVRQMKDAGIEFDMYINLAEERLTLSAAPTPDELWQYVVLPTIEKIIEKKHKIIIWDTWRIVYQSARGHVEKNKMKYKDVVDFSRGTSIMIQGLISKVARLLERKVMNELKAHCDLLIITHHVKDNYVNNVIVGKIPESSATFDEVCNMRIWLRRNQQSKVPIMLFLKRPNLPQVVKGKLQFVNIVPLKITPTDKHESIWDAIAEYEKNPIQSRAPRPDETPTKEEFATISGTITAEQQAYIKTMLDYQLKMEKELAEAQEEVAPEVTKPHQNVTSERKTTEAANIPTTHIQLISRASSQLGIDLDAIEEILGIDLDAIQKRKDEIPAFWETLQKKAKGKDEPETAGGKRSKTRNK